MNLIIIGAGPGGYETAVRAVRAGLEVTLVTSGPLGGTCLNAGCIPTKCLCHSAEHAMTLSSYGLPLPDGFWEKSLAHKAATVEKLRAGVSSLLKGVNVVYGTASFVDSKTVKVTSEADAVTLLTADKIIIATGSESASLPIPGADLPGVLDSTAILELTEIPSSLTVIGGGVIGLEFASIFAALGTEVTVLEYCKNLLPHFDVDLAKRLKQSLGKRGINIVNQAQVTEICFSEGHTAESMKVGHKSNDAAVNSNSLTVKYLCKDKECSVSSDKVLMAVGRRPRTAALNLESAGVEYTKRGISVDSQMRTSNPDVYAIGDVNGIMMLAHTAVAQGKVALNSILDSLPPFASAKHCMIRTDIVPAAVFTVPEVASVGLTEEECEAKGIEYKTVKSFYRANGKALAMDEPEGYCKIIVAIGGEVPGQILGCHIIGAHSSDLIAEIAALMNFSATLDDLDNIIHAHPTLSEILVSGIV